MNPLTNVKNLNNMNERELAMGVAGTTRSWHMQYADSAWIFFGGVSHDLTEGDIISVFSQYGEIVHINLVRCNKTGHSRGFGFLCYEDQRSTILAVDNLNGFSLCKRIMRVDHVETYKLPKDLEKLNEDRKRLFFEGCAPKPINQDSTRRNEERKDDSRSMKHSSRKAERSPSRHRDGHRKRHRRHS